MTLAVTLAYAAPTAPTAPATPPPPPRLTPERLQLWVRNAQPRARLVYASGDALERAAPPAVRDAAWAFAKAGLVTPHIARRHGSRPVPPGEHPLDWLMIRTGRPWRPGTELMLARTEPLPLMVLAGVFHWRGRPLPLTAREAACLAFLFARLGETVPAPELAAAVPVPLMRLPGLVAAIRRRFLDADPRFAALGHGRAGYLLPETLEVKQW